MRLSLAGSGGCLLGYALPWSAFAKSDGVRGVEGCTFERRAALLRPSTHVEHSTARHSPGPAWKVSVGFGATFPPTNRQVGGVKAFADLPFANPKWPSVALRVWPWWHGSKATSRNASNPAPYGRPRRIAVARLRSALWLLGFGPVVRVHQDAPVPRPIARGSGIPKSL